jgi:DinB superfamily
MDEIQDIRDGYLNLRDAIATWVHDHLRGDAWYFQPTPLSNAPAWIVGHLIAFEQQFVYDAIPGYAFPRGASPEVVERYKPGVAGFAVGAKSLIPVEEALASIARLRETSDHFLSAVRSSAPEVSGVDRRKVIEAYGHHTYHDTEHFGQLKYLSGTWERLHP